jgi:hypothetical protein
VAIKSATAELTIQLAIAPHLLPPSRKIVETIGCASPSAV